MSEFNDFEHRGYKVEYHSSKGILMVIYYEIFDPNGRFVDKAYSSSGAKAKIDGLLDGDQVSEDQS